MKLNAEQKKAIEYVQGPCLVLAGAGSGKTRVIINKIAYLIQVKGYLAHQIAALTFTNKAAREMKERIGQVLGKRETRGLRIATFHTLGLEIIRREHQALGLKANFSLFDDHDQLALLSDLSDEVIEGDKETLKRLQQQISRWKGAMISPATALAQAQTEEAQDFARIYADYQTQQRACSILDFDDLIGLPTALFREHEAIREQWQRRIRYLLIDEYQDTNVNQYALIKLLVGDRHQLTVVGDDDQSIYAWRGANPENLMQLQNDFPDLNVIKLEQNYRSTPQILHAANILIANNPHLFTKKLYSAQGDGEKIVVISAESEDQEAEKIVKDLISHRFMNDAAYGDYAILYRGNHQSKIIEKWLLQHRIPYRLSGGTSFFSRPEIKDLMAYLRLLTNPDDDNALIRIINIPRRDLGSATVQKIGELAQLNGQSLFRTLFDPALAERLPPKKWASVQQFAQWFETLIGSAMTTPMATIQALIPAIDYESWIYETSPSAPAAQARMGNVMQLLQWLEGLLHGDDLHDPMTLEEAVMRFTLRDMMERNKTEDDLNEEVQLMTLHASKGLEFNNVYLMGLSEGLLPHQTSIDEESVDEERRLAYVGLTRARQRLVLTYAKQRRQYGETTDVEPSRFLLELPQDLLIWRGRDHTANTSTPDTGLAHLDRIKAKLLAAKQGK